MNTTKKIILILFTPLLCFSQSKENGVFFINTLLQEKNFEKSYTFLDDVVKKQLSIQVLEQTVNQLESQLGLFNNIIETNNENQTYFYYSNFEKMKLDIKISFNENNKIIGFFFVPHKQFKKENSLGKDLNIKSNDIELKGTLLNPENAKIKKLVIFVHGSGPNDRDETVVESKPFKEIAEHLFLNGISSYRFDKRTLSNPESFNDQSTIDDEVTKDVINIIDYFKNQIQFSKYEIILIGHSLGANLLPRIANLSKKTNKLILLAGNSRPLDQLILEQFEYLSKINPSKEIIEQLQKNKTQIDFLNSKNFNLTSTKDKLPLNLSAIYWTSIKNYKPLKEIQKLKIPILILQGERDYQVTMKDFQLWKSSLKNNKQSVFKSYPKLNHLFIAGENQSTPNEYLIKGNIDKTVLDDIYNFITK